MKVEKVAKAGTLESNDIVIMVSPNEEERIDLIIESIVMSQFGDAIEATIREKLKELGVTSVILKAQDKGALDYTIRARVESAVLRAVDL